MSIDESLMEKLSKRDKRAMSDLYDRYHEMVWRIAWRKHADPVYCEQLVLQVFKQLWKNPHNFNGNKKLAVMIMECCRSRTADINRENTFIDKYHSNSK